MMKKNKFLRYLFLGIILAGIGFLLFNDSGFIKYLKLKSEVDELNKELISRENENRDREAEIDSLEKKNPAKIEKVAREKYGMMKKGEKIIKIEEK
jgi:cell division protein FtsB